jgi:hypothetical protein
MHHDVTQPTANDLISQETAYRFASALHEKLTHLPQESKDVLLTHLQSVLAVY